MSTTIEAHSLNENENVTELTIENELLSERLNFILFIYQYYWITTLSKKVLS